MGTATEQRAIRNYAGHRLAPWLAHVMVSRQETARQLLTPGEVMQISPDEELVLLSGMAPIRASKLRYFRDRNFAERRLPAPSVDSGLYADCPAPRPDDWNGIARPQDARLAVLLAQAEADDDSGPQQQRTPGQDGGPAIARDEPDVTEPQLANDDDGNSVAYKRAMEQAQPLTPIARGFAFDESQHTRDFGL